jgi:hypothetical protein
MQVFLLLFSQLTSDLLCSIHILLSSFSLLSGTHSIKPTAVRLTHDPTIPPNQPNLIHPPKRAQDLPDHHR